MSVDLGSGLFNLALLAVELFLLVVTIVLLVLNRREFRGRNQLIEHISMAADVVTRQEYFVTVLETLQGAEHYVRGVVTGSPPSSEEGEVINQLLGVISSAVGRGVDVRYLLPHAPDRLHMAQRYRSAGAVVKFNAAVLVSDARFMVVDDKEVVVGLPVRKGQDEPTKKGHLIPSESVASLFREQFDRLWDSPDALEYERYLKEVVASALKSSPRISPDLIATNLKLDRAEVERAMSASGPA